MFFLPKHRLAGIHRLAAAVIDVGSIAGENGLGKVQFMVSGCVFQQNGCSIVGKGIFGKTSIVDIGTFRIKVEAGLIIFKSAAGGVGPCLPVAEDGGIPIREPAALGPHPACGGNADAAATADKIQIGEIADVVLISPQLNSGGKCGTLSVSLGADQVIGTVVEDDRLCVGHGGKVDIDRVMDREIFC